MAKSKLSKEEIAERKRMMQRKYYLKRKAQWKERNPKKPDLMVSAESIQKNWLRIQRTVFREDVLNYFVLLYQRKSMNNDPENCSNIPASVHTESINNQKISAEAQHDVNDKPKN